MMIRNTLVLAAWLAAVSAFPTMASAACQAQSDIAAAFDAKDEAAALAIAANPVKDGCSPEEITLIGRIAALTVFNRISSEVAGGGKLADHAAELETLSATFGGPWQVLDAVGDINRERKNYAEAAKNYQSALESADDKVITPDWMAPDEAYIKRLDKMANEMRLASSTPVQLASRGGCKIKFRGVTLKKKSTPVRYVFGTADFSEDGLKSAQDLAECLKTVNPKSITLIGHTDPVGGSEANKTLSLARAETLAKYLVDNGYHGGVKTEGRGEDDPFKPDDAGAYDEETLNQMNRRVEVDVQEN